MEQQINLYLPEFKVKKDPLTTLVMGQILGGVVAVMVLVSGYQLLTRWQLNADLAQLQATLQEETRKTGELDALLIGRSENTELTKQLEEAEDTLLSRRQIKGFLNETQLGNVIGFSEFFKDLSRATIDGLSLTEFTLSNGGENVTLSGLALDSAMVPRYVSNLKAAESSLRNKHFSPSISRDSASAQYFSFSMSSTNE